MATVPIEVRTGSAGPGASEPCCVFSWCTAGAQEHSVHQSETVPLPGDGQWLLYAETDPDTGRLLYGPILSGGDEDAPIAAGRVLAAELRAAAARIELLVARVEMAGGAA